MTHAEKIAENRPELIRIIGERRAKLRQELASTTETLRPLVMAELEAGRPEAEVARLSGIDRMTLRKWQGKPRS